MTLTSNHHTSVIPAGRPKLTANEAKQAIEALRQGVWDDIILDRFGPLHTDREVNIREIAACAGLLPESSELK